MNGIRTRRAIAAGLLAAALGAAGGFLTREEAPPADRAARFVPADALVYLHASTDPEREGDRRLWETLNSFESLRALRERLEGSVSETAEGFDLRRDVRSWLGDEAAVALLDTGGTAAETLLLLSVADEPKAQGLLSRVAGAQGGVEHRGIAVRRFGTASAAFVGGFLAVGQESAVKAAIDLHARAGAGSLATQDAYVQATADRPEERSLHLYAPAEGVRRVLRAQDGLGGAIGATLDHPALRAVSISAVAEEEGLRLHLRQERRAGQGRTFSPALLDAVPADSALYAGFAGLDSLARLLPATGLDVLLRRLEQRLPVDGDFDVRRDLIAPLQGEVAVSIGASLPVPQVTLIARTADEARTREALSRVQAALVEVLSPAEGEEVEGGQVPTFRERRIGGIDAYGIQLAPGLELIYAVFDGKLVVSTAADGIDRVRRGGRSLRDERRFERVLGEVPERPEALAFVDLAQLLTLGEQVGLAQSAAFQTARDDLRRLRALGAAVEREGPDTTAELFLEIP